MTSLASSASVVNSVTNSGSHFGDVPIIWWIGFNVGVLFLLVFDLFFWGNGKEEKISFNSALKASLFWVCLALIFNIVIFKYFGIEQGVIFLTGYLVEKSLSLDNLFVFLIIFQQFSIPTKHQHRILVLGIAGALVMRAIFIFGGIVLLEKFKWLTIILGLFLLYSGTKLLAEKFKTEEEDKSPPFFVRWILSICPEDSDHEIDPVNSSKFKKIFRGFFRKDSEGKLKPTKLFFVLITIELTDVIFAVDSIPAILAITSDPFLVYTSNVCAILGLRALYFALAGLRDLFSYLDHALALILAVIGLKMLFHGVFPLPSWLTLGSVCSILAWGIIYSVYKTSAES